MSVTAAAVKNRAVTNFAVLLIIVGGIFSFFELGQLEDPEFTVKTAVITTDYPGASPLEVELEVTDRIELALQELKQLDYVTSYSQAGQSVVAVEIKTEYWSEQLPQVWDELRRKIRDVGASFPPGVSEPVIADDFGDVFGFQLAVVGDGFNYAELEGFAENLKKELSIVEGVARVDLWGAQKEVIYLDVAQSRLSQLGLSDASIENTLRRQNMVLDGGSVDAQSRRLRIVATGEFTSPTDIGDLVIRPSATDSLQGGKKPSANAELTHIRDVGTIRRGYLEPPFTLMRYNGRAALGISITTVAGANVVQIGEAIDERLSELTATLPIGIEVQRVHWMSDVVAEAVGSFLVSFAEALAIVLVVLTLFMGWRMGVVIGSALVVTILGTFIVMAILGIDLQRMSLGALIIALGMMVDNAIVVADGMSVRLQQGMDRTRAAVESAAQPSWPLLGATVVAIMAFYPIFASTEGAGEYCRTLFSVVAIALLVSWLVSVTVTPLHCINLLPSPKSTAEQKDPYASPLYQRFRHVVNTAIRLRWLTLGSLLVLLVLAATGFGSVTKLFFPDSSMTKFMIDIYAPQGTRIEDVALELEQVEAKLLAEDRVEGVSAFIGAGPPRFYLPVDPESPDQAYAQLIVNVKDYREIDALIAEIEPWLRDKLQDSLISTRKYGVGPSNTWKFEARFSGPAEADPAVLRVIADKATTFLAASPLAGPVRIDWRERTALLEARYSQARGRWASVTREDVAHTTKRAFDGREIGLYREGDKLLPILLRHTGVERRNVGAIDVLQIQPAVATRAVPLSQVTDGVGLTWEDPIIGRRDRRRTVTVEANPIQGVTLPALLESVRADFEAIDLPPGYRLEWGGEYEDTVKSQAALLPGMVPAMAIMIFIIVALFNAYRPVFIILLTIPFALIGIVAGLLAFDVAFGFVALLGAMSLSGMMIKNAVVLLDQVKVNLVAGLSRYEAILEAAVSRLRPVMLAAATTVLGVLPLLQDVFWIGLSVTLMAGLTFGTLLTMVVVPVLYAVFYRIPAQPEASQSQELAEPTATQATS